MLEKIKKLFKKNIVLEDKTIVNILDLDKYKIKLNIKTMCVFEQIANKSFLKAYTEDDVIKISYASLIVNNEDFRYMTYNTFTYLIKDERVMKWVIGEYTKLSKYIWQFKKQEDIIGNKEDGEVPSITDIASTLIIKMGMDAHYVYYDMELWEIFEYFKMVFEKNKERLTEKRLFTYVQMLPLIDTKKVKGPEKILPFPWENETNQKQLLEENTKSAFDFLVKNKKEEVEVEENG